MDGCEALIRREIEQRGLLTFARFMEIALYEPGAGFYAAGNERVGRRGDFLTAVSAGPAFGRVLAGICQEVWEALGCPGDFWLVEQGAGDGRLFQDVLLALGAPFRAAVRPVIVEPLAALRGRQQERLRGHGVEWLTSPAEAGRFCGVLFSNELVDAMPFHLLMARAGGWRELYVGLGPGDFLEFVEGPLSPAAAEEARDFGGLPDGWIAEARPAAGLWVREWAQRLEHGLILVFDYGREAAVLRSPERPRGTFRCYQRHRMDERPLDSPGAKDITADVDFTALGRAGAVAGLGVLGPMEFGRFITRSAAGLLRGMDGRPDHRFLRNFQALIRPEAFGAAFQAFGFTAGRLRGWVPAGFGGG